MKRLIAIAFLLLFACSALAEVKLLRHPTYHNGKVAFSYLGDIWIANDDGTNVQRLTVHKARDIYPRFSPDGKWIAFSSNRYGNYDVFIIPVTGGEPRQLTFHSGDDTVQGWSSDSRKVVFQASRGRLFPGIPGLYEVAVTGGLEQAVPTDWGWWGGYSADGSKFAFNRHPRPWWRQHYRGSYAADLWVMDVAQKKFVRLDDDVYRGNYLWPMYGNGGDIFFVSDRLSDETKIKPGSREVLKSANNIWKMSDKGGKPVQVTHHSSGSLFFPSISADRRYIVYEENFGLWKLDTQTGKSTEIKINIVSDDKENQIESLTVRGEVDGGYSLSPTSKRAAVSAHGEIFTIATDQGDVQRVTESYSRDEQPVWSPDGKWIAFFSDRSGREEVWLAKEDGTGLKQLSNSDNEKNNVEWAPDSKSLLFSASDHKLYRVDLETAKPLVIASSEVSDVRGATFSPDGRWVAYAKVDTNMRPHVYINSANGGNERHIGNDELLFAEASPRWTRDGKKLLIMAGFTQGGMASQRRGVAHLYSVALQKEEKSLTDRGLDTEEEAAQAEKNRPRPMREGAPDTAAEAKEVNIDFDGITRRIHQVTRLSDNVMGVVPSPDSKTYAFVATGDADGRPTSTIFTIQEDGTQLARIVQSIPGAGEEDRGGFGRGFSSLRFSKDGRTLFFQEGNTLNSVDLGAAPTGSAPRGPLATPRSYDRKRINFTAKVEVDHRAERQQVFAESWRIMKDRFYDPEMHGVNWVAARAQYEPLMEHVADQEEMHNVISQMIGELNASHTGISAGPNPEERDRAVQTRYPGFELEPDATAGFYKVAKIYKDGPADKDYVRVASGDYILAVDGHELKSGDNYWRFFNSGHGRKLEFLVNSKPVKDGAWLTRVEPVTSGAFATLQYEAWVAERKATVDKLSNGEIGYLHIRAMDAPSLRRFEREFVENHAKKALIIDQRFNGGGGIDQELLQIIGQRQYQKTRGRDSIEVSRPLQGFFGHMVVMQNERSASDAEMFPDGFRTLGFGKVIGVATQGAVIGTGSYRLLDGSQIRTPGSGVWNVKGYNLENYGVPPDVFVDNAPEDFLAGRDAQLEKAVDVLREQIKQGPRQLQLGK